MYCETKDKAGLLWTQTLLLSSLTYPPACQVEEPRGSLLPQQSSAGSAESWLLCPGLPGHLQDKRKQKQHLLRHPRSGWGGPGRQSRCWEGGSWDGNTQHGPTASCSGPSSPDPSTHQLTAHWGFCSEMGWVRRQRWAQHRPGPASGGPDPSLHALSRGRSSGEPLGWSLVHREPPAQGMCSVAWGLCLHHAPMRTGLCFPVASTSLHD